MLTLTTPNIQKYKHQEYTVVELQPSLPIAHNFKLIHIANNELVEAKLCCLSYRNIVNFKKNWVKELEYFNEPDKNWQWEKYYDSMQKNNCPGYIFEGYALEIGSLTQGLIFIEYAAHSSYLESGKGLVYIYRLSTAPWNRIHLRNTPDYKGVGTTLFNFAIIRSMQLGFQGRVGLHSLSESEGFYRKLQLNEYEKDHNYHNLKYFELSEENAMLNLMNLSLINNLDWVA